MVPRYLSDDDDSKASNYKEVVPRYLSDGEASAATSDENFINDASISEASWTPEKKKYV